MYTGFIEPHFFAGYSGGPKAVLPALSGAESVLSNHGRAMIAHPKSTWGNVVGNPIWEEMREVALKTMPAFLVNVTVNPAHEITGVFAGELLQAHEAGRNICKKTRHGWRGCPIRRCDNQQQWLSPRPEPVPNSEGHERSKQNCTQGRLDYYVCSL